MEEAWNKKVSKYDILKKLLKYRKLWYNHVTFLGGEPFIQGVFLDALKLWKKLSYTILVTTNCTTLHLDSQASKFLPFIDELFLSIEAIWVEDQQKISRTKNFVSWDLVFENINKYWKWKLLKANIVITQDNKFKLLELVEFSFKNWIKDIAITYPDIDIKYYWKEHILERVSPRYNECIPQIIEIINFCKINTVNLKLPDFPFCVFPNEKIDEYIKLTDDFDFDTRLKIDHNDEELDRWDLDNHIMLPRKRKHCVKCSWCKYNVKCWGPSEHYEELYWLEEIISIN